MKFDDNFVYVLGMCMYPSGEAHIGHARVYTICEAIKNWFKLKQEQDVVWPFGWDAFGLPAEQYAIKHGGKPDMVVEENIKVNKSKFLLGMNFDIDWDFELQTSLPIFYQRTQQIVQDLFRSKLLYRYTKEMPFCETCNVVLAKEQSINDICWRCSSAVVGRSTPQWFVRITNFAREMFDDTELLLHWPEKIRKAQKKWLGIYNERGVFEPHITDWCISRQRYWGTPMPLTHCESCGWFAGSIDEYKLPGFDVGLTSSSYYLTRCDMCGKAAEKSLDTIDTFVDSSWYQYRHLDSKNTDLIFDKGIKSSVDFYVGGSEHAVTHLIYARFMHRFLQLKGYFNNYSKEPFKVFLDVGAVVSSSKFCVKCNAYFKSTLGDCEFQHKSILNCVEKMSKSKLNGVSPTELMMKFDSDVLRTYLLFVAPTSKTLVWSDQGVKGMKRFLDRIQNLVNLTLVDDVFDFANLHSARLKFERNVAKNQFCFNVLIADLHVVLREIYQNPNSDAVRYLLYLTRIFASRTAAGTWKLLFGTEMDFCLQDFLQKLPKTASSATTSYTVLLRQKFLAKIDATSETVVSLVLEKYPQFKDCKMFQGPNSVNII